MILIKENSAGKAEYDEENGIIYSRYKGIVDINKSIEILEAQLTFVSDKTIKALHTDLSELKGTFTLLNNWLQEKFFPIMVQKKLICAAIIYSSDIFSQFAINDMIKRVGSTEIQTFGDYKKAEEWVLEKIK